MPGCCSRPAGPSGPIRSPHFVRLTWTFSPFHDMNRETPQEAARAVTDMLDDMRRSGWDHTPLIKSIAVGDHREGTEHPINLQELYHLAGVARQVILSEYRQGTETQQVFQVVKPGPGGSSDRSIAWRPIL